jgi:FixJ family two-component response regulator
VESLRFRVQAFASAREFLETFDCSRPGCLLLNLPKSGAGGLELLRRLGQEKIRPPVIFISAAGDVPTAVEAMRSGALNFLEKPCEDQQLREAIGEALKLDAENRKQWRRKAGIQRRIARLTPGERDVLKMLLEGRPNKTMAELLELSVRTIEVRRAKVMRKMKAGSLAELVRLTLLAGNSVETRRDVFGQTAHDRSLAAVPEN